MLVPTLCAHSGILNTARITFTNDAMLVNTEVALREILLVHGLRDDTQGGIDADAVKTAVERHEQYITSHLEVFANGDKLTGRVLQTTPPAAFSSPGQTKYRFQLRYTFGDLRPAEVTLRQNMLREFSVTGGHPWHVTYLFGVTQADGKVQHVSLSTSQDLKVQTGLAAKSSGAATPSSDPPAASPETLQSTREVTHTNTLSPAVLLLVLAIAAAITSVVMVLRQKRRGS
jgi:hypothetical protein